jgi:hypothetical protein
VAALQSQRPNGPREEGVFLEVWFDLMKAELKIAREEIAELRREGTNERHWLYTESSLEECSLRSKSFPG